MAPAGTTGRCNRVAGAPAGSGRQQSPHRSHELSGPAAPLSVGHGFPARLVAPGRRGFWWVKWVDRIELQTTPWWWQPPFPVT